MILKDTKTGQTMNARLEPYAWAVFGEDENGTPWVLSNPFAKASDYALEVVTTSPEECAIMDANGILGDRAPLVFQVRDEMHEADLDLAGMVECRTSEWVDGGNVTFPLTSWGLGEHVPVRLVDGHPALLRLLSLIGFEIPGLAELVSKLAEPERVQAVG